MVDTNLGITVDSSQAAAAAVDLDRLAANAVEAGSSVDRLAAISRSTGAAVETVTTATQQASAASRIATASVNALSQAHMQAAAASRAAAAAAAGHTEQLHGLRFAVGNVSAQFQDIAVTSAMGMNPWTIALQQGTQLSSVLGMQGGGLTHVVRTLGAALGTILSPLSLVTIGLVAATSAAIQWGMQSAAANMSSADALEKHKEWLDEILAGYKDAADAAQEAVEEAQKLPQASVESELEAKRQEDLKKLAKEQERVIALSLDMAESFKYTGFGIPDDIMDRLGDLGDTLRSVAADGRITTEEADELHTAFTELKNETQDSGLDTIATEALKVIDNFRAAAAAIDGTTAALVNLNQMSVPEWMKQHGGLLGIEDTLKEMEKLTPDVRTATEKLDEAFSLGVTQARTSSEITALTETYKTGKEALATQERLREEKRTANKESPEEKWAESLADYRDRLDMMALENELWDAGTFEREKRLQQEELLNEAMQQGMEDTPALREEIEALAEEYARLTLAAEGVQVTLDNRTVWESLWDELDDLEEKLAAGVISWETYQRAAGSATVGAIQTTLGALASLSAGLSSAFEENKALSVATAVLKGAESVASSYAAGAAIGGPAVGAAFAAVAAITAAANVAAVLAVDENSTSMSGSGGSDSVVAPTAQAGAGLHINLIGNPNTPTTLGSVEGILREIQDYLGSNGQQLAITYKGD